MYRAFAIPLAAFALSACGGAETNETTAATAIDAPEISLTNATPEQVAEKVGATGATRLEAGQWEIRVGVTEADLPGVPAGPTRDQALKMLKQPPVTLGNCLTPEQAEKPNTAMLGGAGAGSCTYRKFAMGGGRIDATMLCAGAKPGEQSTVTMTGTFSKTAFDIESRMRSDTPGLGMLTVTSKTSGHRTGTCKA
jgi:hypothetical protein